MTTDYQNILKNASEADTELPEISLIEAVEAIRDDLDFSKSAMASKLGISKSHYGNFVNGLESVSAKRAGEWARILGQSEKVFVKYSLQELLTRNNYSYKVSLSS